MDADCWEEATQEDGLCDSCRMNDCMGKGRVEKAQFYRSMTEWGPDPGYWLRKAERLEAFS
jgi:hypothetical protein